MSIEIDEDPKVVMVIPPGLLTNYRKAGLNSQRYYGYALTQAVITNYESYIYYRDIRKKIIMEQEYVDKHIFKRQ